MVYNKPRKVVYRTIERREIDGDNYREVRYILFTDGTWEERTEFSALWRSPNKEARL